jgi:hypothetical protein
MTFGAVFVSLFDALQIELHEEVREAELLLQAMIKERDILKSFKEKKFMVNQATIDQLRDEMRTHAHLSKEGIARLEAEMAEERDKCQRMVDQIRREIEAQATEQMFLTEVY